MPRSFLIFNLDFWAMSKMTATEFQSGIQNTKNPCQKAPSISEKQKKMTKWKNKALVKNS